MLSFQKNASDKNGLGYQSSTFSFQNTVGRINFVKVKTHDPTPQKESKKKFVPIFHHCDLKSHIKPHCSSLVQNYHFINKHMSQKNVGKNLESCRKIK